MVESSLISGIVERLAKEFLPEKIILFGSAAREASHTSNDIDLLVIARSSEPLHIRMARAYRALRGVMVAVDVIVCTPDEATRYSRWLGHTIAVAMREGIVIYG